MFSGATKLEQINKEVGVVDARKKGHNTKNNK